MVLTYHKETQAWMIHWKMTNIHVQRTKYATRKKGNRCNEMIIIHSLGSMCQ